MNIGYNLFQARKQNGLSQEQVAEKLGVSRQTISKWETDETIPDIYQAQKLARLYKMSLEEIINYNPDLQEIEEVIKNTNEEKVSKINWTNAWSKKYPVLSTYPNIVNISKYASIIRHLLEELKENYGYNELDSMLVLKDILYHEWKDHK